MGVVLSSLPLVGFEADSAATIDLLLGADVPSLYLSECFHGRFL